MTILCLRYYLFKFSVTICLLQNGHHPFAVCIDKKSEATTIPMWLVDFRANVHAKIYERKGPVHEHNYSPFGARTRASNAYCPVKKGVKWVFL